MKRDKPSVWKVIFKVVRKRFKLRHLLFLAVICSVNSFAWFIYMNKVDSDISVKVKAWNVSFQFDNQTMTDYISFDVYDIYPGIPDRVESLTVFNDGDVDARLSYEIVYASIFGEVYDVDKGDISSSDLALKLEQDYPFKISVDFSNEILSGKGGSEEFRVSTVWPYESFDEETGNINDDADTYWGNLAYDYMNNNDSSCIELRVKISATQIS